MSKEAVSANTERVFRENETKANRMLTMILNVTILVVVLTWLLFESGFFYIRVHFRALMIFNVVIMGIASGISRYFKYEKKWIKYLLMGTLTLVYAGTTSALTYNVALLIAIPIILSIRYFSKRYTMFMRVTDLYRMHRSLMILPCFVWNIRDLLINKTVISTWIGGYIHE